MTSMRQVWRALSTPNPIKCACCRVFGYVWPICPALWCDLLKKCTCGLELFQPAQRTMSKVIFDGFSLGFGLLLVPIKPKWGPNCAADVPVRGARARLVQEHQLHNWDPFWASFSKTRENRVFKT